MTTDPPEEPVALVAVRADDDLINALKAGVPVESTRVDRALSAWKADVDAQPLPVIHAPRKPNLTLMYAAVACSVLTLGVFGAFLVFGRPPWVNGVALVLSVIGVAFILDTFAVNDRRRQASSC